MLKEVEEELLKTRANLSQIASENDKRRGQGTGVGDVRLLKHKEKGTVLFLTRKGKTLKISAHHCMTPMMELKPNAGSDRACLWIPMLSSQVSTPVSCLPWLPKC